MSKIKLNSKHTVIICIALALIVILLVLRPAVVISQEHTAERLAENYLNKKISLSDYTVRSAELCTDIEEGKYVKVCFDAKPHGWAYMDWSGGSGEEGQDGWLVDKFYYIRYLKLGPVYITLYGVTGL